MAPASAPKYVSKEDFLRLQIPTIDKLPTLYRPVRGLIMVAPLPDQNQIGEIILPDRSRIVYNEGHILAMGPYVSEHGFKIGDCVTWDKHSETPCEIEGIKFVLIEENNIILKIEKAVLDAERDRLASQPACPEGKIPVGETEALNYTKP